MFRETETAAAVNSTFRRAFRRKNPSGDRDLRRKDGDGETDRTLVVADFFCLTRDEGVRYEPRSWTCKTDN